MFEKDSADSWHGTSSLPDTKSESSGRNRFEPTPNDCCSFLTRQDLDLDKICQESETCCAVLKPDFTDLVFSEEPELIVTLDKQTRKALDRALGPADEAHGQNFPTADERVPVPPTPLDEVAGEQLPFGHLLRQGSLDNSPGISIKEIFERICHCHSRSLIRGLNLT